MPLIAQIVTNVTETPIYEYLRTKNYDSINPKTEEHIIIFLNIKS